MMQIAKSWGVQILQLRHRCEHGFQSFVTSDKSEENAEKNILWQVQVDEWDGIEKALQEIDEMWGSKHRCQKVTLGQAKVIRKYTLNYFSIIHKSTESKEDDIATPIV